jgi:Lon protease-like protein
MANLDDRFAPAFEDLPRELIVFPLPGALLLPYGRLPLNIFEERYLNMIEDALAERRMFGMVQTKEPHASLVPNGAELFDVGCAGRIVSFAETGDGRFVLTLEGVCRFKIQREIEGRRGYRRMAVDYAPYRHDLDDDGWKLDREPFFELLKTYLDARGLRVDAEALERAPDKLVIATLGMMCPFDLKEKQALVEAKDMDAMTEIMRSLMQMSVIAGEDQSTAKH